MATISYNALLHHNTKYMYSSIHWCTSTQVVYRCTYRVHYRCMHLLIYNLPALCLHMHISKILSSKQWVIRGLHIGANFIYTKPGLTFAADPIGNNYRSIATYYFSNATFTTATALTRLSSTFTSAVSIVGIIVCVS